MTKFIAIRDGILAEVDASFSFEQNQPAAIWVINHTLGKFPAVLIVDSGGTEVEGVVSYPSSAQVIVEFSAGFSGMAYLN